MRHLSSKIAAAKSSVIARYKIGGDCFSISEKNGAISGNYNGYDILKYEEPYKDKAANIFGSVVAFISDLSDKKILLTKSKNAGSIVSGVNSYLKNFSKKVAIEEGVVKIIVPEFDVGEAVNQEVLIGNLKIFQNLLRDTADLLSGLREQANILSGVKIVSSMWGASPMQQILNKIKCDIEDDSIWGKLDFFIEMIDRSIERLAIKLNTDLCKVCAEEKTVVGNVLIPNIINNYETLTVRISKILAALEPLINIDGKFKKETSYPATWFIKGNMMVELKEDFDKLLKIVLRTPEIEQRVLFPLDVLKTKFNVGQ